MVWLSAYLLFKVVAGYSLPHRISFSFSVSVAALQMAMAMATATATELCAITKRYRYLAGSRPIAHSLTLTKCMCVTFETPNYKTLVIVSLYFVCTDKTNVSLEAAQ